MRMLQRSRASRPRAAIPLLAAALGAAALTMVPVAPAGAAQVITPNGCRYSLDPGTVRNIPLTLNGTVAPASVASGGTVNVSGLSAAGTVPGSLIVFGYYLGALSTGVNNLPVNVSITLEGTNTVEGTKVVTGTATASTTVTVTGIFASATDVVMTVPLSDTSFTANGSGPVTVRQAGISVNSTPITNLTPTANFDVKKPNGDALVDIDCQPGEQNTGNGPNGEAPYTTLTPATTISPIGTATIAATTTTTAPTTTAAPTTTVPGSTTTVPGPTTTAAPTTTVPGSGSNGHTCISGLGRYVSAEVTPLDVSLIRNGATTGTGNLSTSVSFSGARVALKVPDSMLVSLYRRNLLPAGASTSKLYVWAAIKGSNTLEGVQTVGAETTYTTTVTDPTPDNKNSGDETATGIDQQINLPTTTWTATGAGPVEFSEAPAGSMSTIGIVGKGYQDTGYFVQPYGSIFVRAETSNYGANLDCFVGTATVKTGTGIPGYSNFGDLPPRGSSDPVLNPPYGYGSQGRYTITPGAAPAPVYTVSLVAGVGPGSKFQVVTTNVIGSPLTLDVAGQLVTLPSVKLNGSAQTTSGAMKAASVVDARGLNTGWNLVGSVTDFEGDNGTIPGDNLGWTPTAAAVAGTTNTPVAGASTTGGLKSAPATLCSGAVGSSNGSFTCGGQLKLNVPADTSIGTYTGLLTLTLI